MCLIFKQCKRHTLTLCVIQNKAGETFSPKKSSWSLLLRPYLPLQSKLVFVPLYVGMRVLTAYEFKLFEKFLFALIEINATYFMLTSWIFVVSSVGYSLLFSVSKKQLL
jgi:hypothetical protein